MSNVDAIPFLWAFNIIDNDDFWNGWSERLEENHGYKLLSTGQKIELCHVMSFLEKSYKEKTRRLANYAIYINFPEKYKDGFCIRFWINQIGLIATINPFNNTKTLKFTSVHSPDYEIPLEENYLKDLFYWAKIIEIETNEKENMVAVTSLANIEEWHKIFKDKTNDIQFAEKQYIYSLNEGKDKMDDDDRENLKERIQEFMVDKIEFMEGIITTLSEEIKKLNDNMKNAG